VPQNNFNHFNDETFRLSAACNRLGSVVSEIESLYATRTANTTEAHGGFEGAEPNASSRNSANRGIEEQPTDDKDDLNIVPDEFMPEWNYYYLPTAQKVRLFCGKP